MSDALKIEPTTVVNKKPINPCLLLPEALVNTICLEI